MIANIQYLLATWALTFDLPILDWIQAHMTSPMMDKIMTVITLCGEPAVWVVLCLILVMIPKTRKFGWSATAALVLGLLVCNATLKPLIARIRPYDLHEQITGNHIDLLVKTPHDWSFPSGHTIAAFEFATALWVRKKSIGIPVFLFAILLSFSRLYIYVHYPTDVFFSVAAGILFGLLGCLIVNIWYKAKPAKKGKYER